MKTYLDNLDETDEVAILKRTAEEFDLRVLVR